MKMVSEWDNLLCKLHTVMYWSDKEGNHCFEIESEKRDVLFEAQLTKEYVKDLYEFFGDYLDKHQD